MEKVTIEMRDGKVLEYVNVGRVADEQYRTKVYGMTGDLLASIDNGDMKNLYRVEAA